MIDTEMIKMLSPLGIGGLLAGLVLYFYRQDFLRERSHNQAERQRQERREDRLLQVLERNAAAYERLAVTIDTLGTIITKRAER
jgi:hypothetical protein